MRACGIRRSLTIGLFAWALMSWLLVGCGGGGSKGGANSGQQQETTTEQTSALDQSTMDEAASDVYVGYLTKAGAPEGLNRIANVPAMIGLHVAKPTQNGTREFRAFVCDGLGSPNGMVAWFQGSMSGTTASATSVGDQQTLEFQLGDEKAFGAYTDAEGLWHEFFAPLAFAGAGIYDISISKSGAGLIFTGKSTNGATLEARDDNDDGLVRGVITADYNQYGFLVKGLAEYEESVLRGQGLPTTFSDYQYTSNVPGTYVALVSARGYYWLGRSGNIREGRPGDQSIALGPAGRAPAPGGFSSAFDESSVLAIP